MHEVVPTACTTAVRRLLRQGLLFVLPAPLALPESAGPARKLDEAAPLGAGAVAEGPATERRGPTCRAGGWWVLKHALAAGPGTRGGAAVAAGKLGRRGKLSKSRAPWEMTLLAPGPLPRPLCAGAAVANACVATEWVLWVAVCSAA